MISKKKILGMIFLITLLVLSLNAPLSLVYATKPLTVGLGKQYSTISEAILASNPGDEIHVYPGIYCENVVIEKNGLKIIGVEGAEQTILDGTGLLGTGIYVYDAEDVTIQGLTITEYNFGILRISGIFRDYSDIRVYFEIVRISGYISGFFGYPYFGIIRTSRHISGLFGYPSIFRD